MSQFDDVRLEWAGQEYVIKANRVLGAIARIEDAVTLSELAQIRRGKMPPMAKISMAWGAVLRYAGANVTDDDIYAGIFGATGDKADAVITACSTLLGMMIPPKQLAAAKQKETAPGNGAPAASASSKRPSSSRSARRK